MVNVDLIKAKFREQIHEYIEQEFASHADVIQKEFQKDKIKISRSLFQSVKKAADARKLPASDKEPGKFCDLYISFLRTSVITDISPYRLDLYDDRGRLSVIEYSAEWNFEYVFTHYFELKKGIKELFSRQSRVGEYEMDAILYDLAEQFHTLACELFPEVIMELQPLLSEIKEISECLYIYLGGYLDKVTLLTEYHKNNISAAVS